MKIYKYENKKSLEDDFIYSLDYLLILNNFCFFLVEYENIRTL